MLQAAVAALVISGCATPATTLTPPTSTRAANRTCGTVAAPPAYKHVVWIWMENHSFGDIIGNTSQAPYLNSLARDCGLATNYHSLTHPSLPNYIGATSGLAVSQLGAFGGDCDPSPACGTAAPSIFGQRESWKAYAESMPSACARVSSGLYAAKHNPPPYYRTLAGCGAFNVPFSRLAADLANNALPAFSFISPNLVNDMHDGTISDGDSWLSSNLPTILNSPEYTSGTTAVFITWDEGSGGSSGESCAANASDESCHVATLVVSPSTPPGTRSGTLFNHYSLLATAEEMLGLPRLGSAASAATLTGAFHL